MKRQRATARAGRTGSHPHIVTLALPPDGLALDLGEIDREARRISAGRCGRWTSPGKLHVGFAEPAHRDAFVLWLTMSGVECG